MRATFIGSDSVLGFIPTNYPKGVVLAETWDYEYKTTLRYVGVVDDIDSEQPRLSDSEYVVGRTNHELFSALVKKATAEIAKEV